MCSFAAQNAAPMWRQQPYSQHQSTCSATEICTCISSPNIFDCTSGQSRNLPKSMYEYLRRMWLSRWLYSSQAVSCINSFSMALGALRDIQRGSVTTICRSKKPDAKFSSLISSGSVLNNDEDPGSCSRDVVICRTQSSIASCVTLCLDTVIVLADVR